MSSFLNKSLQTPLGFVTLQLVVVFYRILLANEPFIWFVS